MSDYFQSLVVSIFEVRCTREESSGVRIRGESTGTKDLVFTAELGRPTQNIDITFCFIVSVKIIKLNKCVYCVSKASCCFITIHLISIIGILKLSSINNILCRYRIFIVGC